MTATRPLHRRRLAADPLGLGTDQPNQGPAGNLLSRGLGRRRNLESFPAAVGTLLLDAQGRPRPNPRGPVAKRRRGRAIRPPRRHRSDLPRPARRLRPARLLPVDYRADRAEGDRGVGTGLAATAGKARPRRAVRSGAEAAVAAIVAAGRPGDQSHRRGHSRFPPGPQAAMAGRRRARRAHASPGRRRRRGDRRRHRNRQPPLAAHRLPGAHPRRRQPGRPLGVQRGDRRAGGGRLADSGRLGHRPRGRRDAFGPCGRRAAPDAQRSGRIGCPRRGRRFGRPAAARQADGGGVAATGRVGPSAARRGRPTARLPPSFAADRGLRPAAGRVGSLVASGDAESAASLARSARRRRPRAWMP